MDIIDVTKLWNVHDILLFVYFSYFGHLFYNLVQLVVSLQILHVINEFKGM